MKIKQLAYKDGFWWCISAILGSMIWIIPNAFKFGSTEGSSLLLSSFCLLIFGAVIGCLKPTRPWRWGIASVLLLPFAEIVRFTINSSEMTDQAGSIIFTILYELVRIPIYALIAIPAILGAYIGSYFSARAPKRKIQSKSKNISRPWILGLILGLLVSCIPSFFVSILGFKYLLLCWFGGLFIAGLKMGISFPNKVWKWGIAVGLGLPIVVIIMIIYDIFYNSVSHNLFPLEIFGALFIAAVSSFPGAYIGKLIRKIIKKE